MALICLSRKVCAILHLKGGRQAASSFSVKLHYFTLFFCIEYKSKKEAKIRNQYNQEPHLTRDTKWESDKNTRKHHTQKCKEVSL